MRIDLVYHGWVGEHDRAWTDEHDGTKVSVELLDASTCSALVCVYHLEDVWKLLPSSDMFMKFVLVVEIT